MKSGFIAILGKPNVGKSSLMNALIGEKISIVSPKPQTTRDKILGIVTTDDCQMIFVDTPGVHKPRTKLGEFMSGAIRSAEKDDADVIVIVLDLNKPIGAPETEFIEKYLAGKTPVYVVLNKTDLVSYAVIYPVLARLSHLTLAADGRRGVKEIIPVSCRTGENIDTLKKCLENEMPEGSFFFAPDEITDKSERYLICEIVREKALLYLQEEIPHGIGVYIQSFSSKKDLASIEIDIICEKESHKSIIIGKDGEKLKVIGEKARHDIEKLLGQKAYLKLFVKVRKDWRNKKSVIEDITRQ